MANRKITQFTDLAGGQTPSMVIPVVDPAAGATDAGNLKSTLNDLFKDLGLNTSDKGIGQTGVATLSAPAVSAAGQMKWYYDTTLNVWMVSRNAAAYQPLIPSAGVLTAGQWPYVATTGVLGSSSNATLDSNGIGTLRQLAITALGTAINSEVLYFYNQPGNQGWVYRFDPSLPNKNLILRDDANSKDVLVFIPAATYGTIQLDANQELRFTTTIGVGRNNGTAVPATVVLEVNNGSLLANAGQMRDILVRSLYATGGTSASNWTRFTSGAAAQRTATWPDMTATIVGSSGALTAGRIPFGVAIDGAVGLVDSSDLTFAASVLRIGGNSAPAGELRLGTPLVGGFYTALKPQAQVGNVSYTLPAADGSATQVLSTDGAGTLSWQSAASAAFVGARLYVGSDVTVATGTPYSVEWFGEDFDTGNFHSTLVNVTLINISVTGYYRISGRLTWEASAGGTTRIAQILKNGTTTTDDFRVAPNALDINYVDFDTIVYLTAGDFVQVVGYQDSGGNLKLKWFTALGPYVYIQYVGN